MSRLGINTGNNPNDGQGDPLRIAMGKINNNFTEIYNVIGDGNNLISYASTAGISTLARNLTGSPRINVSGILNSGITTTEHLEVRNITSTGVVTATQFVGDGSQLTNVTALVGGLEVLDDNVRKGVARELNFGANIVSTGPDGVGRVTISVPSIASTSATSDYTLVAGISSYASVAGIATNAQGLTGTPNISVNQVGISSFLSVTGITSFYNNIHIEYDRAILIGDGNELKLFHDGSYSFIDSTGDLIVTTQDTSIILESNKGPIPEPMGVFNTNGSVELYYDGSKQFETTSDGATIFGDLNVDNNLNVLGISSVNSDLYVFGVSTFNNTVEINDLHIIGGLGINTTIFSTALEVVGNSKFIGVVTATRFESTSSGTPTIDSPNNLNINAINVAISTDLTVGRQILANKVGISSYLTVTGISTFLNNVHIESDRAILIGDNNELQLFHSGVDSYIDNNSAGNLIIRDSGIGIQLRRSGGGPSAGLMAAFNNDAGVELYYDSVLKLQTFQNGVAINDSVGIGSTAGNPPYRLTVSGIGATVTQGLLNAIADLTSSVDGYGQVNIRNSRSAPNASGDLVITADIGNDASNYIDLGINNTGFSTSSWTINGPLDGYLYSSDSNLSVGVAETNKYFSIFAGGTLIENEKVRVTETGVGIGTTNPTSDFHVQGDLFASGVITTTDALFTGNISILGDFNKVDSNGIITARTGLTIGIPEIVNGIKSRLSADGSASFAGILTSGISIPTELRTRSVAEKTTLVSGNTVGLSFTTGGGNVAICTNPSGDITLNVTDIPTDSSFDNHSISFSVVVNQTGTSRTCTTITLNGVSRTIRWAGGSLANAISGVTTTSGFDIFTFTGINTVGSASTTTNYVILGSVSGGFA